MGTPALACLPAAVPGITALTSPSLGAALPASRQDFRTSLVAPPALGCPPRALSRIRPTCSGAAALPTQCEQLHVN